MPLDIDTYSREPQDHQQGHETFEAQRLQQQRFHGDWNYRITATSAEATRPKEPK